MKTMNKLFSVALSIVLAFGVVASVAPATATADSLLTEYASMVESVQQNIKSMYSHERRAQESASIIQANQILNSVQDTGWYAGQYIDSNGRLHVRTTNGQESNTEILQIIQSASLLDNRIIARLNCAEISSSPEVIIEDASYSMRHLQEIMAIIRESRPDFVHGWGIDEENNNIFVELAECTDTNIQTFKDLVIDSPAVVFVQSNGIAVPQASIYSGSVVYPTSSSRVTITMFASKNNQFGFITVGHTLGNTIKTSSSGSTLGTTSSSNKVMNSTADGSWTKLNSGHTGYEGVAKIGSTKTDYVIATGASYLPVQGATVSAYLGRSGAIRTGTIACLSHEYTCAYSQINSSWSNITCYDIYVTGLSSQGGDSGSPLFNNMEGGGMVIWGSLRSGDGTNSNYCNIHSVVSALGVDCTYY